MKIAITRTEDLEKLLGIYTELLRWVESGRYKREIEGKAGAIRVTLAARERGEDWAQERNDDDTATS